MSMYNTVCVCVPAYVCVRRYRESKQVDLVRIQKGKYNFQSSPKKIPLSAGHKDHYRKPQLVE